MKMSAVIEFQNFRLMDLNYSTKNASTNEEEVKKSSLRVNVGTTDVDKDNNAQLELEVHISDAGENYIREIKMVILGVFKINDVDSYTSDIEQILRVNGTAIMMPYIRSLMSSITSFDDSTDHILLPTMNVQEMFDSN